jgi:acyl-homoserine lactone acylase PvdQ
MSLDSIGASIYQYWYL